MLRHIELKSVYKSDQDNILEDFYFPTLAVARSYDRAVGFFSASTISYAAQALSTFVKNDGHIRLVLGAFADASDIEAVNHGLRLREISEQLGTQFLQHIGQINDELFQNRFEALSWLVAHGRMEIKIALRLKGMYHDKIGIISDRDNDAVAFSGSANESAYALVPTFNYESIDVFPSWRPELESYYRPHRNSFDRLWTNRSRGTAVLDIPTAVHERLLNVAKSLDYVPDPIRELNIAKRLLEQQETNSATRKLGPRAPNTINGFPFEIRTHQREALNSWRLKGDFQGIFDLATGAGKTITAVYAIVQMAKQIPGLTIVIAAPYQNLADQWCDILEQFNIHPIQCYVSKVDWIDEIRQTIHEVEMAAISFAAIVVVNRTLKSPDFQAAISRIPSKQFLWIGDECHHHASETFETYLPQNAQYRIGLSATPEHYLDEERNDRLHAYYGQTVYTYSLKRAIEDKVLTPYNYFPCIVEFTASEAEEFIELSDEIGRQFASDGQSKSSKLSHNLTAILMRRARVVASAANKIRSLELTLEGRRQLLAFSSIVNEPGGFLQIAVGVGLGRHVFAQEF